MKAAAAASLASDGFCGYYYPPAEPAGRAMIVLIGDDGNDFMDKACARWLTDCQNCGALCIAVRQNPAGDTGVHGWPLDCVEAGVRWLQNRGIGQIGILGMSMQAAMALSAAARIPELSLVIAFTPCDFVPWGFFHGKIGRASNAEWPSGGSAFCWRGQALPFQPAGQEKEAYWQMFCNANKQYHEMHSRVIFDYSERQHAVSEECKIPLEHIRGKLVLVGCEDDSMWDAARYIRRIQGRLAEKSCPEPEVLLYPYGTHLLVPRRMLRAALPVIGGIVPLMFASGRRHRRECRQARADLDGRLTAIFQQWK